MRPDLSSPVPAPEDTELGKALDYPLTALEFHGCLTGDCPHNHANHCVDSLGEHIREMVAELRTAHRNALAEVSRLRSQVERMRADLLTPEEWDQVWYCIEGYNFTFSAPRLREKVNRQIASETGGTE